ncbi:hypothetical protein NB311A_01120 [Nitrobacter sp. Nb-311A]|nr:hypothetical protein NB311A_01120 [Nitrobacter sp. Nb-311A]
MPQTELLSCRAWLWTRVTASVAKAGRSGRKKWIVCWECRTMIAARKRGARKSVRQSAWITLDGGFAARPCVVLDLSAAGAKIKVDDVAAAPGVFRLAFSRDAREGRPCKVVWRREGTLGVRFIR